MFFGIFSSASKEETKATRRDTSSHQDDHRTRSDMSPSQQELPKEQRVASHLEFLKRGSTSKSRESPRHVTAPPQPAITEFRETTREITTVVTKEEKPRHHVSAS